MTTTVRTFRGRTAESDEVLARLSSGSQAALRQFSVDRLLGYGLAHADVVELRAAVVGGDDWQEAATNLADALVRLATGAAVPTRVALLRRASAMVRMSQMMLLDDSDARRSIFGRAAALYAEAAALAGDRQPVLIDTATGPLAGWLHPAVSPAVGSAIVIGGVEGWAMDFAGQGVALAARGIDALMLDGPGQGESRFAHGHYLGADWMQAYRGAVDFMARRAPDHRIGFVGNSMGGSFALAVAAADPRIAACCDNGGIAHPIEARDKPSFFAKMVATCGTGDGDAAAAIWDTVDAVRPGHGADFPLLIVQGGNDPLVPTAAAEALLAAAPTTDKQMVVFSDGDHCIYNHRDDRDALIADWVRARLAH